jgi:hypothetical protein
MTGRCPLTRSPTAPIKVVPAEFTAMAKAHRQDRFPVGLLQAAFNIKVEDSQASVETDKRHILNALTGMPLEFEPPRTHAQYDRINQLLHAHYALGGLPRCVDEAGEPLKQCLAALRASPPTDRFAVSAPLDDATASVGNLGALLTLNLFGCANLTALPESVGDLGALQTLDLSGCSNLKTLPASTRTAASKSLRGALAALQPLRWRVIVPLLHECSRGKHAASVGKDAAMRSGWSAFHRVWERAGSEGEGESV